MEIPEEISPAPPVVETEVITENPVDETEEITEAETGAEPHSDFNVDTATVLKNAGELNITSFDISGHTSPPYTVENLYNDDVVLLVKPSTFILRYGQRSIQLSDSLKSNIRNSLINCGFELILLNRAINKVFDKYNTTEKKIKDVQHITPTTTDLDTETKDDNDYRHCIFGLKSNFSFDQYGVRFKDLIDDIIAEYNATTHS